MRVVDTIASLRELRAQYTDTVAFIPTMGALHEGHISLIRLAKANAKHTIVSIFVNPTQFGPNEDFESYPRTREKDLSLLETIGVDIVFFPQAFEIYPRGVSEAARIYIPNLGHRYCGKSRPTFFEGVCSIVLRFFLIINPTYAVFGEKDFQQVALISSLIEDLYLPIHILRGPIVREPDGLAMSSRNQYLSPTERQTAAQIYKTLSELKTTIVTGSAKAENAIQETKTALLGAGIRIDYLVLVNSQTLENLENVETDLAESRILFAGYVGDTRLIDNISIC